MKNIWRFSAMAPWRSFRLVRCGRLFSEGCFGFVVFWLFSTTNPLHAQWVQPNSPSIGYVRAFAVSPSRLGGTNLFAGTDNGGVYFSTDNGTSWKTVNTGLMDTVVFALAVSPPDSSGSVNLFAGTLGGGVFLSTNNGASWKGINAGLTNSCVLALAVSHPDSSGSANLFAGTLGGVFLSSDNGISWTAVNTGLTNTSVLALASSSNGAGGTNLFAGTEIGGIFLSTNNGTNWNAINTGLTNADAQALAIAGTNLFAGTGGGVFLSTNNGASWKAVNTGLTHGGVMSLAVSPACTGTSLFAGVYGGGVWRRPMSEMITSVPIGLSDLPTHFSLDQNYPNPFNPTTNFELRIANCGFVSLKVYDMLGREVATLVNEVKQPGEYTVMWDASKMSSGVYFYRLVTNASSTGVPSGQAGSFSQTKKLTLIR